MSGNYGTRRTTRPRAVCAIPMPDCVDCCCGGRAENAAGRVGRVHGNRCVG